MSPGRGIDPFLTRSPTLGERISLAELTAEGHIPGRKGVTLTDRTIRFGDLYRLTERTGVEYALTRETIDGGRVFRLYSGGSDAVWTPLEADVRLIGHTHPSRIGLPSRSDIRMIDIQFLKLIKGDRLAPIPHGRVIFGPNDANSTIYYPTLLR